MAVVGSPQLATKHHTAACPLSPRIPSSPSRMGEKILRAKVRKLMGWVEDSEVKERGRNKWCKDSHFPPPTRWLMPSWFPSNGYLLQTPSPQLLLKRRRLYGTEYPFAHLVSAVLCPLPASGPCLACLLRGRVGEEKKALALCGYCSAPAKAVVCY